MALPIEGGFADTKAIVGYDPVPAGTYTVEVTQAEERESGENAKNPGSPYINWELTIRDDEEYEGRKIFNNTSLTEKAKGFLKGFLLAFHSEDELDAMTEFEPEDYVGRRAVAVVGIQRREGQDPQNRLNKLLPLDAAEADLPTG